MTREDRLAEIVTRYFQARERGAAPDPAALIAEHSDLADDLKSFFAAQSQVDKAAQSFKAAYDPNLATVGADANLPLPAFVRYFGDYELLEEIARGGMGVVYKARQVSLNRTVALKMILSGQLASESDVQRFRQEAEAAANLDHPNVLPIYEVGEHQGQQYFSMKLVQGGNLAARLPDLRQDLAAGLDLFLAVGEAVHCAHQRGLLHRDLKPANILIDADGTPYVTDFGLAKKVGGDSSITQSGAVVGTPSYMAPEQARASKTVTTSVDVYSLGAMLYEYAAGRPPFRGDSVYETIQQVIERDPADPRSLNPAADRDLCVIALKCLAKDPGKRYPTVAALLDDLGRCRRGEPITARPVGRVERLKMWARRNPKLAASLAGTYLALLGGVVAFNYGMRMSGRSAESRQRLYEQTLEQQQEGVRLNAQVSEALAAEKEAAYHTRLSLALNEWQLNNPARANELLAGCEPAQRGWEWGFLRRMMHAERTAFTPDGRGLSALTFTPDGKRLVTAGLDNRIRLWDPATGKLLNTFAGHTGTVRGLAFSPDGRRLVSMAAKETLAWDLQSGGPAKWAGPTTGGKSIDLNAKGQVVVARWDKQVLAYGSDSDKELYTVPGESAAWDPRGTYLATVVGSEVVLCDPATGNEQARLTGPAKALTTLVVGGDGKRLAAVTEDRVYAWDVPARRLVLNQKVRAMDIVVSRDGKRLAAGGQREVRFWDLDTGDELPRLRGLSGYVLNVAFRPDGRSFAAATGDFLTSALRKEDPDSMGAAFIMAFVGESMDKQPVDLRVWDAPLPEFGTALAADDRPVKTFAVGPNGLLAVGRESEIELWSIPERRVVKAIPVPAGDANALAISPDGQTLLSGGTGKEVRTWDTATGAERPPRLRTGKEVSVLAALPDGRTAAVVTGNSNAVVVWDFNTGREKSVSFADAGGSTHLAVGHRTPVLVRSSSGGVFITNDSSRRSAGRAFVIDTDTGLKARELAPTQGLVRALALSPDDRVVAALSGTKLAAETLQFLDVETGTEMARFPGDSEVPTALAFAPDGRRLVVGTDASLKFWDAAGGKLILTVPGAVGRLAFTPEGTALVVQREHGLAVFETTPPPAVQPLPTDTNVGGDPPTPTAADPDPFPKSVREVLNQAEERLNRKDPAGAFLYALRAAEADTDPARQDFYRRSLSLYRQALPRLGDTGPSAEKTPLVPEQPLDRQMRNVFGPDGETIVFLPMSYQGGPHAIRRFDPRTARELGGPIALDGLLGEDTLRPAVPTADGKRLVVQPTGPDRKDPRRWIEARDLETGEPAGPRIELPPFAGKREASGRKALSVTGEGRFAVLDLVLRPADEDDEDLAPERTRAWELATGKELTLPTRFHRLAFSPDGRYVLAVWSMALAPKEPEQPTVVYDLTTLKPTGQPIPLPRRTDRLLLSRDGKFVVATEAGGTTVLRVFEVATGRCTLARRVRDNRLLFALSPAGDRVVLERESYKGKECVEVRDTATGRLTQTGTTLVDHLNRLAFSPDGRFVVADLWGNRRQLIDVSLTEPVGPPLPCASSSSENSWADDPNATFADGGQTLLTRGPWAKDHYLTQTHFYRWSLAAGPVNPADERARAELVAGRVVTAAVELAAIPADEYRRRWAEARAAHPDWFSPTAPAEPAGVPTAPAADGQSPAKPPRPDTRPDYAAVFARHGRAEKPPLVSIADALAGPVPTNRVAALDHLVLTRPGDQRTLDLLAEGLKDSAIRGEVETRLEQLGPQVTPVAPALVAELATQWKHGTPSKALIRAVGRVGPAAKDAVPALREYLASVGPNYHSDVENEAVRALGRIGPDARAALPELVGKVSKLTSDSSRPLLVRAVERVAAGHEAELIPLLGKHLEPPKEKPNYDRGSPREHVCELIAHFGPKLKGIEPALRKLLAEPVPKQPDAENGERVAALEALWRVTGNADEVVPLLDAELKRRHYTWPSQRVTANGKAAAAIGRIGGPAKTLLPALELAVRNPNNLQDRVEIAEAIWRVGGKPDAYLAAAKARFEEKAQYFGLDGDKIRTIRVLAEIGPPARELVPAMLALAKAELDQEAKQQGFKFSYVRQDEEEPDPNLQGKFLPVVREALRTIHPTALKGLEAVPKN